MDGKLQANEIQDEFHRLFVAVFYISWGRRFLSSTRVICDTFQMVVGWRIVLPLWCGARKHAHFKIQEREQGFLG
jgi:hypothetical protein